MILMAAWWLAFRLPSMPFMSFSADDLTAYGTLALAVVTLAALGATIWFSLRDAGRQRSERREDLDRQHEAQAAAVQVTGVETVAVINHGTHTITAVQARLCLRDGGIGDAATPERFLRQDQAVEQLGADTGSERTYQKDIVTPWDVGLRFRLRDTVHGADTTGAYPVVRWTDWWGNQWQYQRGDLRPVPPAAAWNPASWAPAAPPAVT
jgi:hypothetical protein